MKTKLLTLLVKMYHTAAYASFLYVVVKASYWFSTRMSEKFWNWFDER